MESGGRHAYPEYLRTPEGYLARTTIVRKYKEARYPGSSHNPFHSFTQSKPHALYSRLETKVLEFRMQ